MMGKMGSITTLLLLCLALISIAIEAIDVSYDGRAITIDGKRKILFSGSIHYPRSTAEVCYCIITFPHFVFLAQLHIMSSISKIQIICG